MAELMTDFAKLAAPFPADDVEWRVQQSGEKDGKIWARVLAFVTNRAIMDRLDAVCGPANWKNEFRREPGNAVLCGLSIRVGERDEWVTKWDGAEETDIESVKGGLSSAMKRAAVQWGIGRYLYQLEAGYANVGPNGEHYAKTKDNKPFRWSPPTLPAWALPNTATASGGTLKVEKGGKVQDALKPNAPAWANDPDITYSDEAGWIIKGIALDEIEDVAVKMIRTAGVKRGYPELVKACDKLLADRALGEKQKAGRR